MAFCNKSFTFEGANEEEVELKGTGTPGRALLTYKNHPVVVNHTTGLFEYARKDEEGHIVPSGLGIDQQYDSNALQGQAEPTVADVKCSRLSHEGCRWKQRHDVSRFAEQAAGLSLAPPSSSTTGKIVGLCLLVSFKDKGSSISREQVENFCNKKGYNGYGNQGSVRDYFIDNSLGKLDYTNLVSDWIELPEKRAYYTDPSVPFGTRTEELIIYALKQIVNQGQLDLSKLTTDNQGYIKALNVFYAGRRQNDWGEGLWPHSYHLPRGVPLGSYQRRAFDYQITDIGTELSLGTFCHENGHMICDFPDLYDYDNDSNGVGVYCLMCAGGNVNEKNPTEVCAYLKYRAGWAQSVKNGPGEFTLSKNDFYLHRKNPREYFIIEPRFKKSRDAALPGSGLLVWHVDEHGSNNHQERWQDRHYECSLEQADGRFDMEHMVNNGDVHDIYVAKHSFSSNTTPSSAWWDATHSNLSVHSIQVQPDQVSFKAST